MIPRRESTGWRRELAAALTDPAELLALLELPAELLEGARRAGGAFPLRVPRGFAARMRKGDPRDPLLAQVLPLGIEMAPVRGFGADPLGEAQARRERGLLHKYQGRVLLVLTGACAVHCRFCFRRHFPYADEQLGARGWSEALATIAADPSIEEVILSGGDPLSLPDGPLAELAESLEAIPHLSRLRLHTRQPVVLPERVDDDLLAWLSRGRLAKVIVLHTNHAREIDGTVADALARLRSAGLHLLNQTVLLRGVNDSVEALAELSLRLFEVGVLPYYLHLLDRVAGAAHFDLPEAEARSLAAGLAARLPGYLVPRLVREVPGAPAKVPVPIELHDLPQPQGTETP
ncbi:MAG TPA: EF-P beta-lysylation protein EpmB [Thermoanaerobaculia bacterium]|nr:EF-P beta-lysylation protein EpmB [Thermoanaerobaculia bacterium]